MLAMMILLACTVSQPALCVEVRLPAVMTPEECERSPEAQAQAWEDGQPGFAVRTATCSMKVRA